MWQLQEWYRHIVAALFIILLSQIKMYALTLWSKAFMMFRGHVRLWPCVSERLGNASPTKTYLCIRIQVSNESMRSILSSQSFHNLFDFFPYPHPQKKKKNHTRARTQKQKQKNYSIYSWHVIKTFYKPTNRKGLIVFLVYVKWSLTLPDKNISLMTH